MTEGDQFFSLEICHPHVSVPITVTAVYAASTLEARRVLWDGLLQCQPHHKLWIVVGDFNVVVEPWEKRGGRPFRVVEASDFVECMGSAGLFDGGFSGPNFTWCNNRHGRARIWKRLDRLLLNAAYLDIHLSVTVSHLARHPSDHAPLLMAVSTRLDGKPRCFRFINAWADYDDFRGVVKQSWEQECMGPPVHVLCRKLQRLRPIIQAWNKDRVGNFSNNVRKAEAEVAGLEQGMVGGGSDNELLRLHQAQARLNRALAMEEVLWKQRSRVKWLQLGDRNTKFFHSVVKQRRMQAVIHGIQDSNHKWVTEDARIGSEAVKYFSSLFSMEEDPASSATVGVIPKMVSLEDNEFLQNMPSFDEIQQVVFTMDVDSAAGSDGFTGKFFTSTWDIIGRDVYNAVRSFFVVKNYRGGATTRSLRLVKRVLTDYEAVSGQRINAGKSCFLAHPKICPAKKLTIQRLTGFKYTPFPIKYLGFPLYCGRRKKEYFGGLCQAILLRIQSWQNRVLSQGGKIVLVKHVLSSMPTYLLMAASPSKSIFQEIEGMFSNFLWGATEGGTKHHWIRWKDLCVSHAEGGVGLRQLEDVYKAFSIKLWWTFRANSSLWAEFMHARFCRQVHSNLVSGAKGSEVWRRMVKVRNIAERHIGWIVRSGSANFWFDNWLGSGGLSVRLDNVSDHKVADFVQQDAWDVRRILQWVPQEIASEIVREDPPAGQLPDLMIWRPEHSGRFTLKSAFSIVQHRSSPSPLFKRIWHYAVPLRISFFLLRLLRERLPLDCTLWRLGIHGPSRCVCCSSPEVETVEHLFAAGDMANHIWHYFGDAVGVAWTGSAFHVYMAAWWQGRHRNKFLMFVHQVIPLLICWHIWKARNGVKYEGKTVGGLQVCRYIFSDLLEMFRVQFLECRVSTLSWLHFYLEISSWNRAVSHMLVKWVRPSHGALKLNTDGCSKGNPGVSGGGGVLREASGRLVMAFSCNFGIASSMQAEACALLFGVQLCL
ncbi:uncharacterized protein [Coffea arabica]|uniref:RNase H type-1 domain-containing protein n=1 Tax=Coffea arabica TaxID=13443 RepID=A0ABM4UFQ1_COFAR